MVGVKREHHRGGRASHPCILAKSAGQIGEHGVRPGHDIPELAFQPGCSRALREKPLLPRDLPCYQGLLPPAQSVPRLQATLKRLVSGFEGSGNSLDSGLCGIPANTHHHMPTLGNKEN